MAKNKSAVSPVFETLAVEEQAARDGKTGVARPSERAVREAKEWVDENEK